MLAEKFDRKILGIIMHLLAREIGSGIPGEVAETQTELRIQPGKTAALTIGKAMPTAGRIVIDHEFGPFTIGVGAVRYGVHFFLVGGCTPPENA